MSQNQVATPDRPRDVITARSLANEMAMTAVVNVRYRAGTHIAKACGFKTTASSTASWDAAAEKCAEKLANGRPFTIRMVTHCSYLVEIQERA